MMNTPSPTKARAYAEIAHTGQLYNQDVPYTYHLDQVVAVLGRFGIVDPESQCAGYLHDVLEDTNRSYNDILRLFGERVAERVFAVTCAKGRNRRERNEATYPGIREREENVILKLADRIANVEYGCASGGKTDMYAKEFSSFEIGIRESDAEKESETVRRMWEHLIRLLGTKSSIRA